MKANESSLLADGVPRLPCLHAKLIGAHFGFPLGAHLNITSLVFDNAVRFGE